MNLELLDPFRRQIPDRVDATLTLPNNIHKKTANVSTPRGSEKENEPQEDQEWKAAYHVCFNRRGTYLAVGHATGTVAVHDFLSRTLSAVYRPEGCDASKESPEQVEQPEFPNGVTSATWSRRSRTLLAGAMGDSAVRLIDTTHPMGPEECVSTPIDAESTVDSHGPMQEAISMIGIQHPLFKSSESKYEYVKYARPLETHDLDGTFDATEMNKRHEAAMKHMLDQESKLEGASTLLPKRYPILSFSFPQPIGGSLQIHPRDVMAGLAVLSDGSLVIFQAPQEAWESPPVMDSPPSVMMATLWNGSAETHLITCAAFDPHGEKLYAATKDGILMGFDVKELFESLSETTSATTEVPQVDPGFRVKIPGGATAWHLLVSRNGRYLLLNCADSALRVYNAQECWDSILSIETIDTVKPKVFQDVVSKVPFASCDFSGDAEYLVGGCNANDKYDLYVWNTTTGALMDRLTGPQVSLYSVAWHPTRSFLAVATSDGVVDIWGPRMDWTAFAPDFQALPMNVEYIEQEDEFDIVDSKVEEVEEKEDATLDVVKVEPVPVFASDSESESEVFFFETKINNIMAGRGRNNASVGWAGRTEDKD